MSNSSLAKKTLLLDYYEAGRRGYKITKITPHHMAGDLTLETCRRVLNASGSSAHYGIDSNGTIALFVDEANRPYTSCSAENDCQAVTMEVANCQIGGDWRVSDAAYKSLVNLCVDICKRNGIKSLSWTGDSSGTLTCHYMFWATACPGPYLKGKMPNLAAEVNKILAGGQPTPTPTPTPRPPKTRIAEDGLFYTESVKAMQRWLGCYQDGVLSNQLYVEKGNLPNIALACEFSYHYYGGSPAVAKLQQKVGAYADGYLGSNTVTALQKFLNAKNGESLVADGIFGYNTAIAFQRYLNKVL